MRIIHLIVLVLFCNPLAAQKELSPEILERYSYRFTINDENTLPDSTLLLWASLIGKNQIVGLAEKHHSTQLSRFTTAFLPVLSNLDFQIFALEMGPNSAELLNELSSDSIKISEAIRSLNRQYGRRAASKTPLVFVNRKSDALFMDKAQELGFQFWGMDQEYAYSYEMLLDRINRLEAGQANQNLYLEARSLISKKLYKRKVKGQPVYCWYQSNPSINDYLNSIENHKKAIKIVEDLKVSWDIYCKEASGLYGSQQRADYMKSNLDDYLAQSKSKKVFIKMGNVHLTHGISPFGVNDLGKYLTEKAHQEGLGYINIRFFNPYLNGKYLAGKSSVSMLQSIGTKNQWTLIDLRPIRELMAKKEILAGENYTYEILSYDLILLAPEDLYDKQNNY